MTASSLGRATPRGKDVTETTAFDRFARAGLAARGFVYGIVAVLALELALGQGGKSTSQQGALATIAEGTFGKILLVLVAIGLAGYALWRITRAAMGYGPETRGVDSAKERTSGLVSGILYGGLCVSAIEILAGSGSGGGSGAKKATGGVLDWPGGRWLVGVAGVVIIAVGFEQARRGIKKTFLEKSKTERMSERFEQVFTRIGQVGHLARAVVFALMGFFVLKAAIDYDPKQAIGLDGALAKLAHAPLGPLALGATALGLLAFGLYSALDTRYRKI
jgi:hypothetical protein